MSLVPKNPGDAPKAGSVADPLQKAAEKAAQLQDQGKGVAVAPPVAGDVAANARLVRPPENSPLLELLKLLGFLLVVYTLYRVIAGST